ncbi:MAG: hypothetical protein Q4F60_00105 [Candidatus Saccharibacteria bacterium]|nr:hypothetical protein [Candidatus Saccharibacteria bacterium]
MNSIEIFLDDFLKGLPDVVVALLVLVLAMFSAWLVKTLTLKLLKLIGLEKGLAKLGTKKENISKVTGFIGRLVYLIVFILFLPGIFEKLGLNNIAAPIVAMMNNFMSYLPNIIGAVIIATIGLFIARLVKELVRPLLMKLKINSWSEKAGLDVKKIDLATIMANIAYTVIAIFFIVEALNTLQLEVLTKVGGQIIAYLPYAISATIVILIAYLLGNWAENSLIRNFNTSKAVALVAKIAIIVIGVFMFLSQLGIASSLVNAAFIILLSSVGIAFAISFGIGGREFAAHTLRKFEQKLDEAARKKKD